MTHDPVCPQNTDFDSALRETCACAPIAQARADEREKAAHRVSRYLDSTPDWVAHEIEAAAFGSTPLEHDQFCFYSDEINKGMFEGDGPCDDCERLAKARRAAVLDLLAVEAQEDNLYELTDGVIPSRCPINYCAGICRCATTAIRGEQE